MPAGMLGTAQEESTRILLAGGSGRRPRNSPGLTTSTLPNRWEQLQANLDAKSIIKLQSLTTQRYTQATMKYLKSLEFR
jgi:hypothetical protein